MINNKTIAVIFSAFWTFETSFSPKIDQLTAIYFFKFKGAWRTQFLDHALQIFKIIITFQGVLKIILRFFYISHGLENRKIGTHCTIHLL